MLTMEWILEPHCEQKQEHHTIGFQIKARAPDYNLVRAWEEIYSTCSLDEFLKVETCIALRHTYLSFTRR